MAARMDNLASSEDDAILRQLADDQIEYLAQKPYSLMENRPTDVDDISYVVDREASDMLPYEESEADQGPLDAEDKSSKTFILKPSAAGHEPEDDHQAVADVPENATEPQPASSAVSLKIAELISQLQAEKAAARAKQAQLGTSQEQAETQRADEALAEAISGELMNPEDVDLANVRPACLEMPLEDIEATFAPQQPQETSTSENIAEQILSSRMAAEDAMGFEDQPAKLPESKTPAVENKDASEVAETQISEPATQAESGNMKNFLITLGIVASTAIGLMLAYYLFFT